MIDKKGYRKNVGIVLCNNRDKVFLGKRIREDAWQFPQGGIKVGESPKEAMYRELKEEVGLNPEHVKVLGRTRDWLRYNVPKKWLRRTNSVFYKGQKQIWFLLRLVGCDNDVFLTHSEKPEFDDWCWEDYWTPVEVVIDFKKKVYTKALSELSKHLKNRV